MHMKHKVGFDDKKIYNKIRKISHHNNVQ